MSGIDLNKPIGAEVQDVPFDGPYVEDKSEGESVVEQSGGFNFDLGFLKTQTGPGTVEERMDHALNFAHSKGLARAIRGFEGFFDTLNLAIIDIVWGLLEFAKERKANAS